GPLRAQYHLGGNETDLSDDRTVRLDPHVGKIGRYFDGLDESWFIIPEVNRTHFVPNVQKHIFGSGQSDLLDFPIYTSADGNLAAANLFTVHFLDGSEKLADFWQLLFAFVLRTVRGRIGQASLCG